MSEQKPPDTNNELTRRQWLLILGKIAAVSGFSGVVPEIAAALPGAEGQQTTALPPGLYYPSQEHLSNALGDLGSIRTIPAGTETDYVKQGSSPFYPQFFSDEEFKIATRVVEILLGKVDSSALLQTVQWLDLYLHSAAGIREAALNLDPLHRVLAIAYYGQTSVRELEKADPQAVVRSGIATLEKHSVEQYGQKFLAATASQQFELVSAISTARPESMLGKFFGTTRTEAVRGYYTSLEGFKELDYKGNWYYAVCPGCEQRNT